MGFAAGNVLHRALHQATPIKHLLLLLKRSLTKKNLQQSDVIYSQQMIIVKSCQLNSSLKAAIQ